MKNFINFIVSEEDDNKRIDVLIANYNKSLSRTRVKNLILENKLKINDTIINDPSKKISKNDEIIFEVEEPKKQNLKPYKFKLNIVYEDRNLIV